MQRKRILTAIIALGLSNIISAQEQPSARPNASARLEETNSAGTEVRKDLSSKPDVPLSQPAIEAVRVSERWRGENISPIAGADGRVIYNFGAGLPTVVCAPLRVCMIELQSGEKLEGEP